MNGSACVFIQRHRFHEYIVGVSLRKINLNELKELTTFPEDVGVRLFADLTLELLPIVTYYIRADFLHLSLGGYPVLKTFVVN